MILRFTRTGTGRFGLKAQHRLTLCMRSIMKTKRSLLCGTTSSEWLRSTRLPMRPGGWRTNPMMTAWEANLRILAEANLRIQRETDNRIRLAVGDRILAEVNDRIFREVDYRIQAEVIRRLK